MAKNSEFALSLGFKILEDVTQPGFAFRIYVRYYEAIGAMLVFESDSRYLYAVEFDNEDELVVFQTGEFAITFDPAIETICERPARYKTKIDILKSIGLRRIESKTNLARGIKFFESKYINKF